MQNVETLDFLNVWFKNNDFHVYGVRVFISELHPLESFCRPPAGIHLHNVSEMPSHEHYRNGGLAENAGFRNDRSFDAN